MEVSSEPKNTITIKIPSLRTIITTIVVVLSLVGGGYFFMQNQALTANRQEIRSHVEALSAIHNMFFSGAMSQNSLENIDTKIAALKDATILRQWEKAKQGITFEGGRVSGWSGEGIGETTTLITSGVLTLLGVPLSEISELVESLPPRASPGDVPQLSSADIASLCAQEGGQWDGVVCSLSGAPSGAPCPAPAVECPAGHKEKAIFNSTECGIYYSCFAEGTL